MKYGLLCGSSEKELGLIDEKGHFDMSKFHSHIENCEICLTLMETFVKVMKETKKGIDLNGSKPKKVSSKRNRA